MAPNGAGKFFFPANPDLADILGDVDLDFENSVFDIFLDSKFLDFQVPRFPKSGLGRAWALGRAGPRAVGQRFSPLVVPHSLVAQNGAGGLGPWIHSPTPSKRP